MSTLVAGGEHPDDTDARRTLEKLTKAATVRIHLPWPGYSHQDAYGGAVTGPPADACTEVDSFLGSGFFAGPSWVLTCAHVLYHEDTDRFLGKGERVTVVQVPGRGAAPVAVPGEVAAVLPHLADIPARGWPMPDLALIRLRAPSAHTSVYLSDRPAVTHPDGRFLYQTGWIKDGGRLVRIGGAVTVQGTLGGDEDEEQLRLEGDSFIAGASGGPVVDLVRGEVVAVVKSRLLDGGSGSAVDIAHLRTLPLPRPGHRPPAPAGDRAPAPGDPAPHGAASAHAPSTAALPSPAPAADDAAPQPRTNGSAPAPDDLYQALCAEHDRHHRDRLGAPEATWTDMQQSLRPVTGVDLRPADRARLLGLLAQLPPPAGPAALDELLESLAPGMFGSEQPFAPRGWRDGLGVLHGRAGTGHLQLDLYVRYVDGVLAAVHSSRPPAAGTVEEATTARAALELWEWALERTEELPPVSRKQRRHSLHLRRRQLARPRPAPAPRPAPRAVLLEVTGRGWEPGRFDWRLCLEEAAPDDDTTDTGSDPLLRPLREDHSGVGLDELPGRLLAPLAEAFRRSDTPDAPAVLHIALPHELLGLDVDLWPGDTTGTRLGDLRPVVVRCGDRAALDPAADPRRADRWQAVHPRLDWDTGITAGVIDCEDDRELPVPGPEELAREDFHHVPVLCRYQEGAHSEQGAALTRLVRAGYGVVLWRRRGESGTDQPQRPGYAYDKSCTEFHQRIARELGSARSAGHLPRLVHAWRADLGAGRGETFWSQGVALLYDPPRAAEELLTAL